MNQRWILGGLLAAVVAATMVIWWLPGQERNAATFGTGVDCGGQVASDLCNVTFEVPDWRVSTGCPSEKVSFRNGIFALADSRFLVLERAAYTDVNHDGDAETVVLIACGGDDGWRRQVAVLDKVAGGLIKAMGPIVVTSSPVAEIFDIATFADGKVAAELGDFPNQKGVPNTTSRRVWSTYRYIDGHFQPLEYEAPAPNPRVSDLFLSAADVEFGVSVFDGKRTAKLSVRVANSGSPGVPFVLAIEIPEYAEAATIPAQCKRGITARLPRAVVCEISDGLGRYDYRFFDVVFTAPPDLGPPRADTPRLVTAAVGDGFADVGPNPNATTFNVRIR